MKKTVVLIAFLFVMSVALMAVQAKTVTSYNPNERIENPTQHTLQQMKARVDAGIATSQERATLRAAQQNVVIAPLRRSRNDSQCDPQAANRWTGTTNGTTITSTSEVRGYDAEDGWFCFDISAIPAGATITQIEFNGYVNDTNYPYWSLTPLSCDPVTADAATLYTDISEEAVTGYYLYQNEGDTYATGWKQHILGGTVIEDCQAAMANGWFAMGMASRDDDTSYYINWDGWNETNPPYLTISYDPPIIEPTLTNGAINLEEGNPSTEFTYTVTYADPNGNAPTSYDVVIDGTPYAMTPPEGTPDYTQWQTFTYTTTLAVGSHNYYFDFVADGSNIYFPDTAPGTPVALPEVYPPISGTVVIDGSGVRDYASFQAFFDALAMRGTDGNTVNVEIVAGTYEEEARLAGPITGPNAMGFVNFYPQGGEVIVDGSVATDTAPIYLLGVEYMTFTGLTLINGSNSGFRTDLCSNIQISECTVNDNGWLGIAFVETTDSDAWNNMLSGNYTQQIVAYTGGAGANIRIWNNSVYANGAYTSYQNALTISETDCAVYNNIFQRNWISTTGAVINIQNQNWTTHPNTILNYNNFYAEDGTNCVQHIDPDSSSTLYYATLADWVAASGQDANSVEGDPFFNDTANYDLHISNVNAGSSPAYQNGTNSGAWFSGDFDGDARVTPWDIGADVIVPPASPVLSGGSVTPEYGLDTDSYQWDVVYWHPLGNAPSHIYVHIDGNSFGTSMSHSSGDPGDGVYSYTGSLSSGSHSFYFTATTDMGSLRYPETGELTGPEVEDLSLPYSQGFEGGTIPSGWTQEYVTGTIDWNYQTGGQSSQPATAYEGTYNARFYGGSSRDTETWLITPMFDLTSGLNMLSFWHTQAVWSGDQDFLSVYYKNSETGDWTMIGHWEDSIIEWTREVMVLPDPTSTYWIAFAGYADYGYGVCLDNVEIGVRPDYWVDLTTLSDAQSGEPGTDVIYPIDIMNVGSNADTYDLSAADNTWPVTFWDTANGTRSQITDTGVVASGATVTVWAKVSLDGAAEIGDEDVAVIQAQSQADPTLKDNVTLTTTAGLLYNMSATLDALEQTGFTNEILTYTVSITNEGINDDTYDLSVAGNNWTTEWVDGASVTIDAGDTYDAIVNVTLEGAGGESDVATLTVTSQGDNSLFIEGDITSSIIATNGEGVGFFYTWANSMDPSGPAYDWITHNAPTEILPLPTDDAEIGPYPIGFDFEFYGVKHDSIYFCANGVLNFDGSQANYTNYVIPYTNHNEMIAWFWNDLDPDDNIGGEEVHIYYETMTVDGMDALVFTMQNYHQLDGVGDLTAQVILYSNGNIKFQYMLFEDDIEMNSSTVGIQNGSGTDGVLYEYNENFLVEGMAIMFYYTPLNFTHSDDGVNYMLDWDPVHGAESYNVYSNTDPFADPTAWTLETNTTDTEYTEALGTKKFYAITMVKPDPVRNQTRRVEVEHEENYKK